MAEEQETKYHGPRAFWSGTISFGLVSIPVNLFPANRSRGAALKMLDADGTPLRRRFFCPKHEKDVHPEHIIRGYEVEEGEYVVITDEELESVEPRKSRDIDLTRFVPQEDVPPTWFERGYFLTPAGDSTKAYRLLADVMERTGRVGIATFVMRDKEYLVAILAENGILRAVTLRFKDEIRTPKDVGLPEKPKADSKLVAKFEAAVKKLAMPKLSQKELEDDYADRLRAIAEKKRKKQEDVVETPTYEAAPEDVDEEDAGDDLIATIRRSLEKSETAASRHSRRRRAGEGDSDRRQSRSSKPAAHEKHLESRSKDALYERAKDLDIPGRSHMTKDQLVRAIRKKG